jgi:hemoglobin
MITLLLLAACGTPECPEGQKFNLEGLCEEDTSKPETEESDPPADDSEVTDDSSPTDDSSATDDSTPVVDDSGAVSDWESLGGESGVRSVVAAFISNVAADDTVNWMFANSDLTLFETRLVELISVATGGPLSYGGRDMVSAHAGMAITDAQWGAVLGDFVGALDQMSVPYTADFSGDYPADRLVTAMAGMHDDIVTDPDGIVVLFNQLGGHDGVQALVNEFIREVGNDSRINGYFASTDMTRFNGLLVEQICDATDGYCVYSGRSMAEAHAGLGISQDDFTATVEDLLTAMDTLNIEYTPGTFDGGKPADELIIILAGMANDIIEP